MENIQRTGRSENLSKSKTMRRPPRFGQSSHGVKHHFQNFSMAYRSWLQPYIKARLHPKEFRPILCFLYTDLNCNLNCHYCYSRGKRVPGMTMQMGKDAVDWLASVGCRVLAYMGGEPLVRKDFIAELTQYAAEKGFFVYLPTNGVLLDEAFVDEIGRAGVSTINLAVDAVGGYEGIPKSFNRIERQFECLVEKEEQYGYITFLNINITQKNLKDARVLTEIAHRSGIATDYHINEPPLIEYDTYRHGHEGAWITRRELEAVDELLDWLVEKNLQGYTMVNSVEHLRAMKLFIRHRLPPWPCRAGELSMIIRLDGSFAPCFELYGSPEDWGSLYEGPKFDPVRLSEQKKKCSPHCLSTCNYQTNHYARSVHRCLQWVTKHAYAHFFGIS
jgi:MoaA/NifB/PqqE/SkfB family radical SAM enzyme